MYKSAMLMEVYPRVCGGAAKAVSSEPPPRGLSPRVRGSPLSLSTGDAVSRSIPACAGEPLRQPVGRQRDQVYPRVCGGARRCYGDYCRPDGLSPRVRGSLKLLVGAQEYQVYPRVCGGASREWYCVCGGASCSMAGVSGGLSPRVRGSL